MRLALALVLVSVTGCLDNNTTADGAHLIAHVTSTVSFDQVIITLDSFTPQQVDLGQPTTTYDIDHWEVFDPVEDLKVTIMLNGNALASGEAMNIHYQPNGDGSEYAEITMPLQP